MWKRFEFLNLHIIGADRVAISGSFKGRWNDAVVPVVEVCTALASDLGTVDAKSVSVTWSLSCSIELEFDLPFSDTEDKRITQAGTPCETSLDVYDELVGPIVSRVESCSRVTAEMLVSSSQLRVTSRDRHLDGCGKGGIQVHLGLEATTAGLGTITIALPVASRVVGVRLIEIREL